MLSKIIEGTFRMKIKLTNEDIRKTLEISSPSFPKYASLIINLANRFSQGTRPKVVGQLTDLIQEFPGKTFEEWEQWYLRKYPDAIKTAREKILSMLENLKDAMHKIDENMVNEWVKDLVIVQTFIGLQFQEAILKKAAEIKGVDFRLSERSDESKGIDGYIGDFPISIKPETYKTQEYLTENINVKIIFYKKTDDGIEVDYGDVVD